MINEKLGACFEQICPSLRYQDTYPGESFQRIYDKLKTVNLDEGGEELNKLLQLIARLNELSDRGLIEIVGIFERDLMHNG